MEYTSLTKLIEENDLITVFRHEHPDCDALGSQFGLVTWLRENYPSKQIYALGNETTNQVEFPASDIVENQVIASSLAIVLDTSNQERIDDQRALTAHTIVKIDHHPNNEPYGQLVLVNTKAAATCEILSEYFKECEENHTVSLQTATYLYRGLLTDTLCYATNNTTTNTLAAGAYLAGKGINIPEINRELFDQSLEMFEFSGFVRSHVQLMEGKLAYFVYSIEDQKKWGMSGPEARNFVGELGNVKDFQIWCIFNEKTEDGKQMYDGSLRSKKVVINDIAQKYQGGGHPNASGVKNLTSETLNTLLNDLMSKLK